MTRVTPFKKNVKSSKSSRVSQVKEVDAQEPVTLDQDMPVSSSISSQVDQVNPNTQEKLMLIQHLLDVNMLVWSSNSSQVSQDTEEKSYSFNTCCMSTCLAAKPVYQCVW